MKLVVETLLHRHLDQSAAIGVKTQEINQHDTSFAVCLFPVRNGALCGW